MLRLDAAYEIEQPRAPSCEQFSNEDQLVPWRSALYGRLKGLSDCLLALIVLIVTAPLILLAAVVVKLTSRGPIFYSQVRLGRGGKPFAIYKIRTMRHNCEQQTGAQWSKPGDARITPVGKFLRKSHIDELPQLWNILRGDMSLVGPRPERPEFVPQLERALGRYGERLLVRPGLSGLAQVQLPPDTDLDSVRRKLAHDLCYVQQMSFWLDLRILICTGLHILGLPYSTSARFLALPGGEPVERAYHDSLAAQNEQQVIKASGPKKAPRRTMLSPSTANAAPIADMQPA
jgi:lipopolysaccharide/colanic/teichoic acid biosynthesis glycosyltransferase